MQSEFSAVIEREGRWHVATCPEVPGANGQGKTEEQCLASLADAIRMILDDRRQDALRGLPTDAVVRKVTVR